MRTLVLLGLLLIPVLSFSQSRFPFANSAHLSGGGGGATYTDDFEALTEDQALGGQGDWLASLETMYVRASAGDNRVNGNTSNDYSACLWDDTFTDNQYSEVTVDATGNDYAGVVVRGSGSGASFDGYLAIARADAGFCVRFDNGTPTTIESSFDGVSAGEVMRLEISGTTLSLFYDDVAVSNFGTDGELTDATYSSGSAGVGAYRDAEDTTLDDWEGGDL